MKTTACLKALPVDLVQRLVSAKVTRISLKQMYTMGREVLRNQDNEAFLLPARFLYRELPVRLSQSVALLDTVFPKDTDRPNRPPIIDKVAQFYVDDIQMLANLPEPDSAATEERFTEALRRLGDRQRLTIVNVSRNSHFLNGLERVEESRRSQNFLDRFYSANFGTHLLIGEHLALHDQRRNLVEVIQPYQVAQQAIDDARRACSTHFNQEAPKVQLTSLDSSVETTYIREHLRRILFETVSFSLRSTMGRHLRNKSTGPLPSVRLVMVNGDEDVTFKVSDEAGGTPARQVDRLWHYTWDDVVRAHTAPDTSDANSATDTHTGTSSSPLASLCPFSVATRNTDLAGLPGFGFGRGLPVARLAARYFGGDLDLVSMEGRGTDVYVHLARTDTQLENFPDEPDVVEAIDRNHWVLPPRTLEV